MSLDGRVAFAWNLATMTEVATWRPDKESDIPAFDRAAFRQEQQRIRDERRRATEAARAFYQSAKPLRGSHAYLDAHGLSMRGCEGLKVDDKGWLVVPCLKGGQVMSVQRISPEGEKLYWKKAPVGGTTYTIERPSATLTVLCEGLATGLAIYAAAPVCKVIVCFSTGTLSSIDVPLSGFSVIAGDNDHRTVCQKHQDEGLEVPMPPTGPRPEWCRCNPGVTVAMKAAERLGCGVVWPEGISGSDWADLRAERIQERLTMARKYETEAQIRRDVDSQIRSALMREAKYVRPGAA